MPSTSKKQHNFMEAVAHSPAFAKKVGIPQSVGKDFSAADKGKKFGAGGMSRADVQSINKPKTDHGKQALFSRGGTMATKMAKFEMSGKDKEVKGKGKEGSKKEEAFDRKQMMMGVDGAMKKGGKVKKMSAGGFTKEADGIATKGKTKGTMIAMKKGGRAC
jgi:hypothetical protein